jgi:hypothetical protein
MFLKLFHIIEREGTLQNSFYEARITLIPKTDKNKTKTEKCTNFLDECRYKILNKIFAN